MSIADQALNEAKRGKKVVLIVRDMQRAESLSAAWRQRNTDAKSLSDLGKNDLRVGETGTVRFVSVSKRNVAERVIGIHATYFIEPDAIDGLNADDWSAIRANDSSAR